MNSGKPKLDFIGIGAARCGTTWISNMLAQHPNILMPKCKELHYFIQRVYDPSWKILKRQLPQQINNEIIGEFSPRYIVTPEALERILAYYPKVKIIILLREPVERAFSQYKYFKYIRRIEPAASFEKALQGPLVSDYLAKSRYSTSIRHVFDLFPRNNIFIRRYEDIIHQPGKLIQELYGFLNLEMYEPERLENRINVSKSTDDILPTWKLRFNQALLYHKRLSWRVLRFTLDPANKNIDRLICRLPSKASHPPSLSDNLRNYLYEYYFSDDVLRLENLLGWDLASWRASKL